MKVYLDANIFIYPALYTGKKAEKCKKILKGIASGNDSAITSALTIDEVVWKIMKYKDLRTAILEARRIFALPNVEVVKVAPEDVLSSLRYMEMYPKLTPRDAIHLAVALNSGIYTICSDDSDFDQVGEINRKGL